MKLVFVLTATAVVALCTLPAAQANDEISISFNYDPNAPIEQTYESIERTAVGACRISNFRRVGDPLRKFELERTCKADLMNEVVAATRSETLMAFHLREAFQSEKSIVLVGS